MSSFNTTKDYYEILGANERTTSRDLERLYKRRAAQYHPDKGGSEEAMKSLNEAYGVLKNKETRDAYDAQRAKPEIAFVPATTPTAQDVGVLGRGLSSLLCLILGLFLLILVRSQWFWFLWPLAILSLIVIGFGIIMARGAMHAMNSSLAVSNPWRRLKYVQEVAFWCFVIAGVYGFYLLLTTL